MSITLDCITFRHKNRQVQLPIGEILWLEGQCNYSILHTRSNEEFMICHCLLYYQQRLPPNQFFRTHKKHLVAISGIESIVYSKTGIAIELFNNTRLSIAKMRQKAFVNRMESAQKQIQYV